MALFSVRKGSGAVKKRLFIKRLNDSGRPQHFLIRAALTLNQRRVRYALTSFHFPDFSPDRASVTSRPLSISECHDHPTTPGPPKKQKNNEPIGVSPLIER